MKNSARGAIVISVVLLLLGALQSVPEPADVNITTLADGATSCVNNLQRCTCTYGGPDTAEYVWSATAGSFPLGNIGPDVLWLAPDEPSTVDGVTISLSAPAGSDSVDVTVVCVDLQIKGASEDNEVTVGVSMAVNDDDDNDNQTPDKDETGTVTDENDLVAITLAGDPLLPDAGTITLRATVGETKIRVWETVEKHTQINLPKKWNLAEEKLPSTLYVEGYQASDCERDIDLRLEYVDGGETQDYDHVTITVVD